MESFLQKHLFKVIVFVGVVLISVLAVTTVVREIVSSPEASSNTSVKSWGNNDSGQLGSGHLNVGAGTLDPNANNLGIDNIKNVYAGLRHSFALTTSGEVFAWGDNQYGQLGNGKTGGRSTSPQEVGNLPKITMLATKQDHTLALDDTGHVWAWGLNMSGQIGDGANTDRTVPHKIAQLSNVTYIATGYRSSVAVKRDGSVWEWGGNCNLANRDKDLASYISQLTVSGYSDSSGGTVEHITPEEDCLHEKYLDIKSYMPKKVEGLPKIRQVSVGFGHTLAISNKNELWSWGCNQYGQLGNNIVGNTDANFTPAKVKTIGKVTEVSAGFRHSLALDEKGQTWAWGHNYFGELGIGTVDSTKNIITPERVGVLDGVVHVSAGHDYSLAVTKEGRLFGWGQASFDQLGKQAKVAIGKPAPLQKLTDVERAASGGAHVLALSGTSEKPHNE